MNLSTFLILPLRLLVPGRTKMSLGKKTGRGSASGRSGTATGRRPRSGTMSRGGWQHGGLASSFLAFACCAFLLLWLVACIEPTTIFQFQFGDIGLRQVAEHIGLSFPHNERALFYRNVLARALFTSEISAVQAVIMVVLLFLLLRLLISSIAAIGAGIELPGASGVQFFAEFASIFLPACGLLSTCIAFLGMGEVLSPEEERALIFGPSAIGVCGFLMGVSTSSLAEYINERKKKV